MPLEIDSLVPSSRANIRIDAGAAPTMTSSPPAKKTGAPKSEDLAATLERFERLADRNDPEQMKVRPRSIHECDPGVIHKLFFQVGRRP